MSYTSQNTFPRSVSVDKVREIIILLGYEKINDGLRVPNRNGSFLWFCSDDYKSYSGVELDLYSTGSGQVTVSTRSTAGRSYWDLSQQNKTIKLLRDIFGGHFETDSGRNRCMRPNGKPPTNLSAGCYLARRRFHNALLSARTYIDSRVVENARQKPTGLHFLDVMNTRLFSNNLILPYVVGIWEDYFKLTFEVLLRYSKARETTLKRARLTSDQLNAVALGECSIEQALAASHSFQRPSAISEHFRVLDPKLDVAGMLRRPYRRRKKTLFDTIEELVECRNEFVHTGNINTNFVDGALGSAIVDFEAAIDRVYEGIARHYGHQPITRY